MSDANHSQETFTFGSSQAINIQGSNIMRVPPIDLTLSKESFVQNNQNINIIDSTAPPHLLMWAEGGADALAPRITIYWTGRRDASVASSPGIAADSYGGFLY